MKMKIHNCIQGTPEWHEVRKGKLTASHAQEIGNAKKGLETYVIDVLAKKYSQADQESYTNEHIERGRELEEQARELFALSYNKEVDQVGFIEMNPYAGCSPDGLIVNDQEGIEIKCHSDPKHMQLLIFREKALDTKYIWQIQMNMLVTEWERWKYIAYNPNFDTSIIVFDIKRDEEMIDKLRNGLEIGVEKLKQYEQTIKNNETKHKV